MRRGLVTYLAVLAALAAGASAASGTGGGRDRASLAAAADGGTASMGELKGARLETLWIFDADFQHWFGDNAGWTTYDLSGPPGQTGIVFRRGQYGIDLATGHQFVCDDRPYGSWMYAAVDSLTGRMVNDEYTVLISPAINTEGISVLIGQWDMWVDLPAMTNDVYNLYLASDDLEGSVTEWPGVFVDEDPGWSYGRPRWDVTTDDWTAFAGNDWLGIAWAVRNEEPAAAPHTAGILLNRQRVGFVVGDPGTLFERDRWNGFKDWFRDDLDQALLDDARIWVHDDDGVASVTLLASNDDVVWSAYPCVRESPDGDWWLATAPATEMVPGSEIHYYYEALDGVGNAAVYPSTGPDRCFEMSILPSSVGTKILLVDKHNERIPGAERDYGFYDPMGRYKCYSEYYYREALEILGYDWDVYDVEIPSESPESRGPDTTGMKYYQTQIWFTGDRDVNTLTVKDQLALVQWLNQSWMGRERNLLISGNDIGCELMQAGTETLGLFTVWLASEYIQNSVGVVAVDSVPGLEDDAGDFDFMTWDDREACLQGGCPELMYFDVIDARPGVSGNEVVASYCKLDGSRLPAGVAYTHPTMGYQTVNLGFGFEFIRDGYCPMSRPGNYTPLGYHVCGINDRVDLMANILAYFGMTPGTGASNGRIGNALLEARPNPFNPMTEIAFSVKETGPVVIRVYSVAGRVVRTLLDTELEGGTDGRVVWDGRDDGGKRCASGVYYYRIRAPGYTASKKMVMLR